MKKLLKQILGVVAALLIPVVAFADDTAWNGPLPMGNDKWLSSRDPGTLTEVDLVRLSPSGNTEINAKASKSVIFLVNKTAEFTLSNDLIALSGTASTLQSAGSLIIKVDADAQRFFTFDAASDTALSTTFGDGSTTALQVWAVSAASANADDDATLCLTGGGLCTGGAANNARGGFIYMNGADVGGANSGITEVGGTNRIDFFTGSAGTNALRLADTGNATFSGTVVSANTSTIGWAVVAGANTACTTTCTSACVFGVNTAATEADIVDCADATADECLCAGAS